AYKNRKLNRLFYDKLKAYSLKPLPGLTCGITRFPYIFGREYVFYTLL
ncbi:unnamed protein product, partial [marine sediment metagenome]